MRSFAVWIKNEDTAQKGLRDKANIFSCKLGLTSLLRPVLLGGSRLPCVSLQKEAAAA